MSHPPHDDPVHRTQTEEEELEEAVTFFCQTVKTCNNFISLHPPHASFAIVIIILVFQFKQRARK